ncbi:MAG: M23 family metallopeptidase [Chloroflexi bacterium]|nr:MAG: M23 family metallopeptidase [Chloroflexota bacterium]
MTEEFKEIAPQAGQGMEIPAAPTASPASKQKTNWLETLARMGLGETFMHIGTNALTLVVVFTVVWLMRSFYKAAPAAGQINRAQAIAPTPTSSLEAKSAPRAAASYRGIPRMALIHTTIPSRPRQEIIKYTIVKGDTVIGIAEKFNLKPQTVLFGNIYTLRDDPHNLRVGQEINILPVDGYYYEWQDGDGLNGVSKYLNVKPEDIINYPLNNLDQATIGNYSRPNIEPGTWLLIPGGTRPYNSWSAPVGVTRDNPAVARVMGPGSCGTVTDGAVGIGTFVWPANKHYLSGFDYSPDTNHRGIDISGDTGEPTYAVDSGVIVYAGWNDWGYGNMIMIDHGTGWQSLYAHLSAINVVCGGSVVQGQTIGAIGSTGNSSGSHLHFELMHSRYSKVNPWSYLPPP